MRVLLQQTDSRLYYAENGDWVADHREGLDFLSSTKAIDFCAASRVTGVQIVLKFDEHAYDIVLPTVGDRARPERSRARL